MEENKAGEETVSSTIPKWLQDAIDQADKKAGELSRIFEQEITPFVFVVEPEKDIAVGFFKLPDAKQSFKLLRSMGSDYEGALELLVRAQLVRDENLKAMDIEGQASDPRFMDANGRYDKKYSNLNMSLMMQGRSLIQVFQDQFKKK